MSGAVSLWDPKSDPESFAAFMPLTVQVKAKMACFSIPQTKLVPLSFPFPTANALRGFLKVFRHSNFLFPVPRSVEVLNPIVSMNVPQWKYRYDRIALRTDLSFQKEKPGSHVPQNVNYLEDVEYRVHFDVYAKDDKLLRQLKSRAVPGSLGSYCPYLGTRECVADLVDVDSRTPIKDSLEVRNMPVGDRYANLRMVRGIVVFPDWTKSALISLRNKKEAYYAAY